ncbi:MAG: hypothetical protein KIT31_05940 [Deltaproteobacteria bacterium]|nr:hypothetical protein [Deltaproteobacteria bacterium]
MNLAERGWTTPALLATSVATAAALLLLPSSPSAPPIARDRPVVTHCAPRPLARCPAAVLAKTGLDANAVVACVKAEVGEPAYFVFGHYTTTEAWERLGVVSADGARELVPFVDRPMRAGYRIETYASLDLDGDGRHEVIAISRNGHARRAEVVTAAGGELQFASTADTRSRRLCDLRVRGAEVVEVPAANEEAACRFADVLRAVDGGFVR